MTRPILAAIAAIALIGCEDKSELDRSDPRIQQALATMPPPADPISQQVAPQAPQPAPAPPLSATDEQAFGRFLRDHSAEIITVENVQTTFGMWTAIVTINNLTDRSIPATEHMIQCVLFDDQNRRVGISLPIFNTVDIAPGESFSVQAAAMGIAQGSIPTAHQCLFQG